MAKQSVAEFNAKVTLENQQFISASNATQRKAREMAGDFKRLDKDAKAATSGSGGGFLDAAFLSRFGTFAAGVKITESAMSGLTAALETQGTAWQKAGAAAKGFFTSLPIVGGLFSEIGRYSGALVGTSYREEAGRMNAANAQRRQAMERAEAKERERNQKNLNDLIREQGVQLSLIDATQEQRDAQAIDDVMRQARALGATKEEQEYLYRITRERFEQERIIKRIADTEENMANLAIEREKELREEAEYMADVQRDILDSKKAQAEDAIRIRDAGKRGIGAMEFGTTEAYSTVTRGGSGNAAIQRQTLQVMTRILAGVNRTASNARENRVATVDQL